MRNKFDRQLQILEEQLIHMGELCESAIANATTVSYTHLTLPTN